MNFSPPSIATRMKAIVCRRYGGPDVLELTECPVPVPDDFEILIRVRAAAITRADTMMRRGVPRYARLFLGLRGPKFPIPGTGYAGEVVAVGSGVSRFQVGDRVFGESGMGFGAYAEYLSVPESSLMLKMPENMSFAEAAPVCDGFLTAWNFLHDIAGIKPGQEVLVNGASGSIGTAAVQLAKQAGARVTAVCSARNHDLVKSLGAEVAIDYREADFAKIGATWDVIFDTVGTRSFMDSKRALRAGGLYLSPVLNLRLLWQVMWTGWFGRKKAKFSATGLRPAQEMVERLTVVREMMEAGQLYPVMDRTFPLAETAEAHRYVDQGHKRGNMSVIL